MLCFVTAYTFVFVLLLRVQRAPPRREPPLDAPSCAPRPAVGSRRTCPHVPPEGPCSIIFVTPPEASAAVRYVAPFNAPDRATCRPTSTLPIDPETRPELCSTALNGYPNRRLEWCPPVDKEKRPEPTR
ncbi:hypothetical protein PIB30_001727 [Stylosanthes scabra]|uniref:Secreted protein n=1 Tax=Stylosanthes scabra TaxID=79078 RepID=A0ABU6V4Z6_9FABA|nr:hypothetical protein [Stylosanthes scabra]